MYITLVDVRTCRVYMCTIFTWMRDKGVSWIWHLNVWGDLKFVYEVPNWTAPNWVALNRAMLGLTKACITKSSCEISCAILHSSGKSLQMLWHSLPAPSSKVKKSNRVRLNLTDSLLWGGLCPSSNFSKQDLRKPALFPFSDIEAPNPVYL